MRRWWLLGLVLVGGLALTFWAVFLWERAEPYDSCVWMPGTQIVRRQIGPGASLGLGESPDRTVLQWSRGRPHSTVTTAHGWHEQLTLELRELKAGSIVHLANDDVRVAYHSYQARSFWNLRPGTAAGTLRVEAVSESSVTASYDITLTRIRAGWTGHRERQASFKGARSFPREARPKDPGITVGDAIQEGPLSDTIYRAAERGDTAAVREFLAKGVSVNAPDTSYLQEGWTPLHHAAFHGRTSVVRYLLAEGADVNGRSRIGNTALHEAAGQGHIRVAELLLAAGADVNAAGNEKNWAGRGLTPLDFATNCSHNAVAALLREHGGKSSYRSSE